MFENLTQRLGDVFDRLTRRGALSEADVDAAMREVRVALLEADVALPVVKDFIDKVRAKAVGETVIKSVTPGQMVVKIVHDHLVETLGARERRSEPPGDAAGADPDGRPAGFGQDDHHGQDRHAPDEPRAQAGADGVARYAPPGRACSSSRCWASRPASIR